MKKKSFTILIGLVVSIVSSYAQGQIMELDLQEEQNKAVTFVPRLSIGTVSDSYLHRFNTDNYQSYQYDYPLAFYYGNIDTRLYYTGSFMASLDLILSKRCVVSLELGSAFLRQNVFISNNEYFHKRCAVVSFVPQFKFFYMTRPIVRLYGTVGIGVTKYFGSYITSSLKKMEMAAQFTPFGIEIGRTFFGFAEIGAGNLFTGARAGIGYRF